MFLPPENVQLFNKDVSDFFLRKAVKEREDKKLQMFCLDKALGFMYDEENLKMAAIWIFTEKVDVLGDTLEDGLTNE